MAIEKQALEIQLTPQKMKFLLANIDTAGMSDQDKYELALIVHQDYQQSIGGFDFKPVRYKIQKDMQRFTDPFGNAVEELSGIIIFKQKTRVLFEKGNNKQPLCSSVNGITGEPRSEGSIVEMRQCAICSHNAWGSAISDGNGERRGKACKEMRRVYLLQSDAQLPIQVSLPPTSLKSWDEYCSARLSQGITDLSTEVVLTLVSATAGGYEISVIRPKVGRKLTPAEIVQAFKYQREFKDKLQAITVDVDDYVETTDVEPAKTEAAQAGTVQDDNWTKAPKAEDDILF